MTAPGGAARALAALLLLSAWLALGASTAAAATITPNTTSDNVAHDGQCSLREAITAAFTHEASGPEAGECAAGTGGDVIELNPGHYFLSKPGKKDDANASGDLDVRSDLTIHGAGAASTIIDAVGIDRVLQVLPNVTVTVEGVTITGGEAPNGGVGNTAGTGSPASGGEGKEGEGGGGILDQGTLTLRDCVVSDNSTGEGGSGGEADASAGPAEAIGGAGGPGGSGGGIEATGPLTIEDSMITGNSTGAGGAGGSALGGAGVEGTAGKMMGAGGPGGIGDGGEGGIGGAGAGVDARAALSVLDSTISDNAAGTGGAGGESSGGKGGGEVNAEDGGGGLGGSALGGRGGAGGPAAGLYGRGGAEVLRSTIAGNHSGAGGGGNLGEGGMGGLGMPGGGGGHGEGGEGGEGGLASGLRVAGPPGSVVVEDDTVTENTAGAGATAGAGTGGEADGLFGSPGSAAGGNGGIGGEGALASEGTAVPLSADTISANVTGAGGAGGTASAPAGGVLVLGRAEHAGNVGGVFVNLTAALGDSIVAENSPANCGLAPGAALADGGHDITFGGPGCPGANVDPHLGSLADNGGPTQTEAIPPGGPAVDAVSAGGAGCPAVDQRGVLRPAGGGCDVGAFEIATPGASTAPASAVATTSATLNGTARNPDLAGASAFFQYGPTAAYGEQTVAQAVAATTAAAALGAGVTGLAPHSGYHFRLVVINSVGEVFGVDQTLTTALAQPPAGAAPAISALRIHPARLTPEAGRGASILAKLRRGHGAAVSYRDSEAASSTLAVQQARSGFRDGRLCAAKRPHRRGRVKRCTRYVTLGSFTHADGAGANTIRFSGRVRSRALRRGGYRLLVTPLAGGRRGAGVSVAFSVR